MSKPTLQSGMLAFPPSSVITRRAISVAAALEAKPMNFVAPGEPATPLAIVTKLKVAIVAAFWS